MNRFLGLTAVFVLSGCSMGKSVTPARSALATETNPRMAVKKMLDRGEQVTLAVVIEGINSISYAGRVKREAYESWVSSVESTLITGVYKEILSTAARYDTFKLVDRNTVDRILEEYKFQAMGYTREVDSAKIGQFLNATHLLVISYSQFPAVTNEKMTGQLNSRLVRVRDASIISADQKQIDLGSAQ